MMFEGFCRPTLPLFIEGQLAATPSANFSDGKIFVFVNVIVSFELMSSGCLSSGKLKNSPTQKLTLRHRLRRDALQRELLSHLVLEASIGAEDDAVSLDHLRGLEVLRGKHLLGIALSLEGYLETAKVVEHHHQTFGEGFCNMVLHTLEHRVAVGLRDGGAVVDALGEFLHGELTGLDGGSVEIVGIGVLGIAYFLYCVSDWHDV